MAEENKFHMTLPAAEIDAALIAAKSAITYQPQNLTSEQQEQARANIGAGLPPVLIDLDTYGETPVSLILGDLFRQGGGVRENVDIGNLMDALLTDNSLRVHFTFDVNVLYAYGVCVGRVNNKAVQLNLNAMFTHQGKTYVAYASIDTPSADEAGKANISMSVEEPGELPEAPVQSVNGQTGDVQLSAADVGALPSSELPAAINTALAQAKASGEFDGKDGVDGKDGYTPQKNIDYFDGKDGQDGSPGKDGGDGVSATHSWNGTVLTVTSASGTSSADLKGEKGDPYTLTDTDKNTIVNAVISALPVYNGEVL